MPISKAAVLAVFALCPLLAAQTTPQNPGSRQPTITPEQAVGVARELWEGGKLAQALDAVNRVLSLDPNNIEAHVLAGQILIDNNNYDLARDHFMAVLNAPGQEFNFEANLGYGRILLANRSFRQAAFNLQRAEGVAQTPEDASQVKRLLATALLGMGNSEEAVEKAREAVQAVPDDLEAWQALVGIRRELAARDPRRAESALDDAAEFVQRSAKAVEQDPSNTQALLRLNAAYESEINLLTIYHSTFYQRNLRGEPTDVILPGNEAKAAAVLHRWAQKRRRQALLQLTISQVQYALPAAERAVQYAPENVDYLETLADLYASTGNRARAIETYQRIRELDPDNERAKLYLSAAGVDSTPSADAAASGN
jgi:tetratricopeptide (TPR) repeat protein